VTDTDHRGAEMTDKGKTKAQLIDEVMALRQQVADLRGELSLTERKRAEEALQHAAAEFAEWTRRYEAAVQATGQVLYDWNSQTDAVLWDGNTEQMLGYAPDELPGTLAETMALVHPADRAAFDQEIGRTRMTKSGFHLTYRLRRKDGAYSTVEDKGHFFVDRAGTIVHMGDHSKPGANLIRRDGKETKRETKQGISKLFWGISAPSFCARRGIRRRW
jgi:PAS domain S-box-containing protein